MELKPAVVGVRTKGGPSKFTLSMESETKQNKTKQNKTKLKHYFSFPFQKGTFILSMYYVLSSSSSSAKTNFIVRC